MDDVEILQRAKDILIKDGWTRGLSKRHDTYCAFGAVAEAFMPGTLSNEDEPWGAAATVFHHLCVALGSGRQYSEIKNKPVSYAISYVTDYNDLESTTFADVMDWFDRAILLAKEMSKETTHA